MTNWEIIGWIAFGYLLCHAVHFIHMLVEDNIHKLKWWWRDER